jgi:phosphoribosyl 1,2-cyclic phosphate phosphodiesterase
MQHEFVLLGSGTSTGVPVPGCRCAVCTSGDPRNFRNRTSGYIRLESGEGILIDATPDLRHQALQHEIDRVDAVLYTHAHADHICGTDDLRVFNFKKKAPIDCFGTSDTLAGVRSTFPYIFDRDPNYKGGEIAQLNLREIPDITDFTVLGSTIKAFPLPHGSTKVTGFRLGSLGYATDCKGLSHAAVEALRGVEWLWLDGLRWEPHRTHNSIQEAIDIARELGAGHTYLIHTTHSVDYQDVSSKLPAGIELGYDGLRIKFVE